MPQKLVRRAGAQRAQVRSARWRGPGAGPGTPSDAGRAPCAHGARIAMRLGVGAGAVATPQAPDAWCRAKRRDLAAARARGRNADETRAGGNSRRLVDPMARWCESVGDRPVAHARAGAHHAPPRRPRSDIRAPDPPPRCGPEAGGRPRLSAQRPWRRRSALPSVDVAASAGCGAGDARWVELVCTAVHHRERISRREFTLPIRVCR